MSKLIQVKMGYGSENIDDDINSGKMKARKKWRASLITTSDASTIQRL